MKEVKFDLVLQVHSRLEEDDLKKYLEIYAINDSSVESITKKVIGEKGSPNNFYIESMKIEEQKTPKATKPKKKLKVNK
tara:strand:- start:74 stop:310 length:237 start_codon:yes stop_codon:yes gene_type:complete